MFHHFIPVRYKSGGGGRRETAGKVQSEDDVSLDKSIFSALATKLFGRLGDYVSYESRVTLRKRGGKSE